MRDLYLKFCPLPGPRWPESLLEQIKVFAFTDPLSLTGYIVPLMLFHSLGIQPEEFFQRTLFTYSHDNSIRAVAERWVDGAAVDSVVYETLLGEDAGLATAAKIIWRSEPFGTPPVVVHPNLDPDLKERIRRVLLNMGDRPDGRAVLAPLGVERFALAGLELYESARRAVESAGGTQ